MLRAFYCQFLLTLCKDLTDLADWALDLVCCQVPVRASPLPHHAVQSLLVLVPRMAMVIGVALALLGI